VAYKTPGVYIVEKNAFPNSVVEVATAVPAFIGYTEKADNKGSTLRDKPWRITSMSQFNDYFGGKPSAKFALAETAPDKFTLPDFSIPVAGSATGEKKDYWLVQDSGKYLLYYSMQLFFQNGGGACYIVSIGSYSDDVDGDKLTAGVAFLKKEQEPTMVVVPEAVLLAGPAENPSAACISVQQAVLKHCGEEMKNRFAILDVYNGQHDRASPTGDCIATFRDKLGVNNLDFAAAYYPWLETTIVQVNALSFLNVKNTDLLKTLLMADLQLDPAQAPAEPIPKKNFEQKVAAVGDVAREWKTDDTELKTQDDVVKAQQALHQLLFKVSPLYNTVLGVIAQKLSLLPPSPAMAGLYTSVDNARGVWKAPANVSLNAVIQPAVNVTHEEQEDLNVTTAGKSINAIRSFIGSGVLVWGARTLDGNSLDWRYVNVRRTMIMLEESLRLAMAAYVFEPNTANTWVTVKGMASNFLTSIWKRGGLAGATPEDAFSVHIGLGETMTGEDILEGRMFMTVLVALSRPAEFIEITFQQQMQKS
jgi:phage tail sheath protein FI